MSECIACTDPKITVNKADNIPLCGTHWNWWLGKYDPMGFGDEPPCGAHLIREVPATVSDPLPDGVLVTPAGKLVVEW